MKSFVYLLLGTNLGNRGANLQLVRDKIRRFSTIVTCSAVYESAAWGKEDQPDFYNQVCLIETSLDPHSLLEATLAVEKELGRERQEKWGSRLIDIDILFVDDLIIDSPSLTVPHPEIPNRRFALHPLNEVSPRLVHPVLKQDIATLLKLCKDPLWVTLAEGK